jgi:hypothetical protein
MERIVQNSEFDVWFDVIEKPYNFSSPFNSQEYIVLLVINDSDVSDVEQKDLSEQLVASRIRYAVCTGYECSTWDDSIDYAFIFSDPNLEPPKERFVMTTWHENESIEDVVEYFRWNTVFDDFVPKNFLALFVGESSELYYRTLKSLRYFFKS